MTAMLWSHGLTRWFAVVRVAMASLNSSRDEGSGSWSVRDGEVSNNWRSRIERSEALRFAAVNSLMDRSGLPGLCSSAHPRAET